VPFDPRYSDAISGIESGGKYDALGPATKSGDRAYGKFQIMGANIAPWTKEILGLDVTPQEFLSNPQLQDAVFQGKFGQYVDKYGPEGAAQAWFAGPGGVGKLDRKDILGTSVGSYGQQFMAALGQNGTNPAQAGNIAATPPVNAPAPQQNQMPAYGWTPPATPASPQGDNSMGGLPIGSPQAPPMPDWALSPSGGQRPDLTMMLRAMLSKAPGPIRGLIS
jgi:hypothetical protein